MIDRMCPFLTFYHLVNIFHGIFLVQHRKGVVLVRFDISVTQILQTPARTDIVDIIFILRNAVQMIQPQNRDIQSPVHPEILTQLLCL